jgi:hypothetical protein
VMNHASQFGSPMNKTGIGRCQENATCPMHSINCKVW